MSTDVRPAEAAPEPAAAPAAPGVWVTFKEAPRAVKTVLAGVLVNRLSGFLHVFLVLFLTAEGYSKGHTVIALGVYGGGAVAGSLAGGTLADRLGIRGATVLSMSSTAVLTAALLYLSDFTLLLCAIALVSLGAQLFRPASATLLAEQTDGDRQIMIFAMYRFGLNVGATAAPLLGYALYNAGGQTYTLLFWGRPPSPSPTRSSHGPPCPPGARSAPGRCARPPPPAATARSCATAATCSTSSRPSSTPPSTCSTCPRSRCP